MQQTYEEELIKTQMEVQEQTLKTIALDIHDNIGQLLSITKLTLSTINVEVDRNKAKQKIDDALSLVSSSIKQLRQLASVLHADNLLASGLETAVENELSWLSRSEQYEINWAIKGEKILSSDPKKDLIAFRLIQELLNNTIKHANASKINVDFIYSSERVQIMIEDNGVGFDISEAMENPIGLGLHNLFKRAKMIGGELVLNSGKGKGTQALLTIPG